jgi:hypothetical protein
MGSSIRHNTPVQLNVLEILKFIENTIFLMVLCSCHQNGRMECWPPASRAYASERMLKYWGLPCEICNSNSEAYCTGVGLVNLTGVKPFSILPGPLPHSSIVPIGAKPLSTIGDGVVIIEKDIV